MHTVQAELLLTAAAVAGGVKADDCMLVAHGGVANVVLLLQAGLQA